MEFRVATCPERTFNIKDQLLAKLKVQSEKFLRCDAMIANLIFDPRIEWIIDGPVFNFTLFKKGFVSFEYYFLLGYLLNKLLFSG